MESETPLRFPVIVSVDCGRRQKPLWRGIHFSEQTTVFITPPGTHTQIHRGVGPLSPPSLQCLLPQKSGWGPKGSASQQQRRRRCCKRAKLLWSCRWPTGAALWGYTGLIWSPEASVGRKDSNQLLPVFNWVIGFVILRQQRRRGYVPSPAHACLSQCHEPGSVPSSMGQRQELREEVQLFFWWLCPSLGWPLLQFLSSAPMAWEKKNNSHICFVK